MSADDVVSVPMALLMRVLEQAEQDNATVEGEFCSDDAGRADHAKAQADIDAMRKAANA
jgi:hypothetical protein